MMSPDKAARIKACHGVYTVGDTARYFGVSKSTVHDIWRGKTHVHVSPALEPDNVKVTRVSREVISEDGPVLLMRGHSPAQAAHALGVSERTFKRHMQERIGLYVA